MERDRQRVFERAGERGQLEHWIRAATTPQRVVWRSRIVLLALDGLSVAAIAHRVGISEPTVRLWLRRFAAEGADSLLHDAPGRGRHSAITPDDLESKLRVAGLLDEHGRVTNLRRAAEHLGVSPSTVRRVIRKLLPKDNSRT